MSELEQKAYIFAVIFTLANKLQVLGDEFDRNLTIKQWLFMVSVSKFDTPPTVSEVAHFVGYSRQNAKRIADDLNRSGYVSILKDKNDARALRIELTPECMAYFKMRELREIEFLENIFTGFDAELTQSVFEGLSKLEQNIEALMALERE
jgi:DNA-binding MarR family transcriptional regulator